MEECLPQLLSIDPMSLIWFTFQKMRGYFHHCTRSLPVLPIAVQGCMPDWGFVRRLKSLQLNREVGLHRLVLATEVPVLSLRRSCFALSLVQFKLPLPQKWYTPHFSRLEVASAPGGNLTNPFRFRLSGRRRKTHEVQFGLFNPQGVVNARSRDR